MGTTTAGHRVGGARPSGRARSLLPREHGAWAALGLPMVSALVTARPSSAGLALACSACAAFLAHEPWLVLDGQRGTRALREDGPRARVRLGLLLALTGISGGIGIALGGARVVLAALAPLFLSLIVAGFIHARREKTFLGEVAAALALPALALPVAVADGVTIPAAASAFVAWAAIFAVGTGVVRSIVAGDGKRAAVVPSLVLGGLVLSSLCGTTAWRFTLALLPTCLACIVVAFAGVSPKDLKRVGWVLAAASLVALFVIASS